MSTRARVDAADTPVGRGYASNVTQSLVRTLATKAPPWATCFETTKPKKGEPSILGGVLPALFRSGYPHLRFVEDETVKDPPGDVAQLFLGGMFGAPMLLARDTWTRFVRAYAGSVLTLSSDPRRRTLTPEAKRAITDGAPLSVDEAATLVRRLMSTPGSLRAREWTEDFVYALEALVGPDVVVDAIVSVLESPPRGNVLPQMSPLVADVALALGFVRIRLSDRSRKALDVRLGKVLAKASSRYPIPRGRLQAFLKPAKLAAPKGAPAHGVSDVLFTSDTRAIVEAVTAFPLEGFRNLVETTRWVLDPRLLFVGGHDVVPVYLEKFEAFERHTHPKRIAERLVTFVEDFAPFLDERVTQKLEGLVKHPLVGETAKTWLALRSPSRKTRRTPASGPST